MIRATSLCKRYRNGPTVTSVLEGVSLQVEAGEFLFLVGPSGSGKSTLLSILGCVLSPDDGCLEVLGRDTTSLRPAALTDFRRQHIGFVFQRYYLFRGLTASENVRVPLDLRGVPKREGDRRARRLLDAVGLADRSDSPITQMSMGQCQRVAVARALVGEPALVFADEPTASLDAASGLATVELLRQLAKQAGATVIVVTHDSRILHFADRVLHLEGGRLALAQPAAAEPRAAACRGAVGAVVSQSFGSVDRPAEA